MRHDVPDVHTAEVISQVNDKPVRSTRNVKNGAAMADEIRRREILTDL
jgi:hypothetical protein